MANPVQLTIQSSLLPNVSSRIILGKNQYYETVQNNFWFMVLDRSKLSIKENFVTSVNDIVPAQLKPYLNDTSYILIVCGANLYTNNMPQGPLYDFLISEGAGVGLMKGEQMFEALNCSNWSRFGYSLVAILGNDSGRAFEEFRYIGTANVQTLLLNPIDVNGQTIYTPVSLD